MKILGQAALVAAGVVVGVQLGAASERSKRLKADEANLTAMPERHAPQHDAASSQQEG